MIQDRILAGLTQIPGIGTLGRRFPLGSVDTRVYTKFSTSRTMPLEAPLRQTLFAEIPYMKATLHASLR